MADYPIEGGLFEEAFDMLDEADLENLRLKYLPSAALPSPFAVPVTEGTDIGQPMTEEEAPEPRSGKRVKYTCPCGLNIWGKGGLSVKCNNCQGDFTVQ